VTPDSGTQNSKPGTDSSGDQRTPPSATVRSDSSGNQNIVTSVAQVESAPRAESAAPVEKVQRSAPVPIASERAAVENRVSEPRVEPKPVDSKPAEHRQVETRPDSKPSEVSKPVDKSIAGD